MTLKEVAERMEGTDEIVTAVVIPILLQSKEGHPRFGEVVCPSNFDVEEVVSLLLSCAACLVVRGGGPPFAAVSALFGHLERFEEVY